MSYKIALIGAGQLGSRHLQGIAKSTLNIDIEVVEPFETSREVAKTRFEEIPTNDKVKSIKYLENIGQLAENIDLVIVATNADVRFMVVEELLSTKKVKNLILEKVLFQKIDDYTKTKELLQKSHTKCWVNHPRRMYPFYQELKEKLKKSNSFNFSISGGNWGLACNGLHFLDLISYLSNSNDFTLNTDFLDKEIKETKRTNFIEFTGNLIGKTINSSFSINSFDIKSPMQFSIASNTLNAVIDESNGWIRIKSMDNDWKEEIKNEKIVYFQSELTNIILDEILNKGMSSLPTYEESMKTHLVFLDSLLSFINNNSDEKFEYCPIT
ncbi:Gfo/Idh/MocA family oxidoreductase [Aliarcobacter butzleri]|uniref:Gfo/Idh/MocA family oxidoreductase n=1 Tax=Aliarcobacter butzleri TaxID=28197 RepID=UPI001EDAB952|nr:Gfo/Idh/MocA family oxidoreductase [Aliarcobacter butzleri]MCG3683486.1 Gfo/Idh/MocA family oxidoreductase [Aliarcobacter butzleri]